MMLHIEGLVVSDKKIFFMFSYLAYVNHVTPGVGTFLVPGTYFEQNSTPSGIIHGYTALNIHEIWPRLLWGEHILYIRGTCKMTSFFNIR